MDVLTIVVLTGSVLAGAVVNADVQRRLLAQGGRWSPATIKSGVSGFAAMIGIVAAYLLIGGVVLRTIW